MRRVTRRCGKFLFRFRTTDKEGQRLHFRWKLYIALKIQYVIWNYVKVIQKQVQGKAFITHTIHIIKLINYTFHMSNEKD